MGKYNEVKEYILEKDWETWFPPNRKEIARNTSISEKSLSTVNNHGKSLEQNNIIEKKEIGQTNFYAPKGWWEKREKETNIRKETITTLKDHFEKYCKILSNNSKVNRRPKDLKEKWRNGDFNEEIINKIAVDTAPKDKVKDILSEYNNEVVEKAWEIYQKEKKDKLEEIKNENTNEITIEEIKDSIMLNIEYIIAAFYWNPIKTREEALNNIEEGEYDDLLREYTAKNMELKQDHRVFNEKFENAIRRALGNIQEIKDKERFEITNHITREVENRENMVENRLYFVMKDKIKNKEDILERWKETEVNWEKLIEETKEEANVYWHNLEDIGSFQDRFNEVKEDVLNYVLEKYG